MTLSGIHYAISAPLYVAVLLALHLGITGWPGVVLGWGFVACRIVHMVVTISSNYIPHRFRAFLASFIFIAALWAYLLVVIVLNI